MAVQCKGLASNLGVSQKTEEQTENVTVLVVHASNERYVPSPRKLLEIPFAFASAMADVIWVLRWCNLLPLQ